jgi:hypothetical protein
MLADLTKTKISRDMFTRKTPTIILMVIVAVIVAVLTIGTVLKTFK